MLDLAQSGAHCGKAFVLYIHPVVIGRGGHGPARADQVDARYDNGVLTVTIPKEEQTSGAYSRVIVK